jgi:tRNA acetyltransferase TAN1
MNFNLFYTTYRYREYDAVEELNLLLRKFGDESPILEIQEVSGVILAFTKLNPFELTTKYRELLAEEPWQFRYILRAIPIERSIHTNLKNIEIAVGNLVKKKINANDSFRITVEKRFTSLRSKEIISSIATRLSEYTVSLENPSWIILVEIIGNKTGISVLTKRDIFSSVMEKRNSKYQSE